MCSMFKGGKDMVYGKTCSQWKRPGLWPQWNINSVEKALWSPMEYSLMVYSPMEKVLLYERLFFEVVIVMVKDKKTRHKRYHTNQN